MDARKNYSEEKGEKLSTAKITNLLQPHNDNSRQVTDRPDSMNGWKSYRPTKPPTFTEDELRKYAENEKYIHRDSHNLRFDKERQMYFYLPKDHPEYKEHPEEINNYRNCTIL